MRGIRIGVLYDLKDKLSGGLGRIKQRMGKVNDLQKKARLNTKSYFNSFSQGIRGAIPSLESFKMKNVQMFEAISDQIPFVGRLGPLLANPYIIALAAVIALIAGITKLGGHMVDVTKEITTNQEMVRSMFHLTGQELNDTTAQIMAIGDVLKVETGEIGKAANSLTKEYEDMGVSVGDSLNAIKTGLVATNGQLDLEELKEYSSQMRTAGLTMEEFVALSVKGRKEGIFGDKAPDTVKEFNLRLKEMTPAAKTALEGIGISSDALLNGLNNGSMTTMDALRKVSNAMKGVSVQARQTAIADLFGGPGEDVGERFLLMLGDMDLSMKSITDEMTKQQLHQLRQIELTEQMNKQQQRYAEILQPVINWWEEVKIKVLTLFNNVLSNAMEWFRDQWIKLEPVIMMIWQLLKIAITPVIIAIVVAVKGLANTFALVASVIRGTYNTVKYFFELIAWGINWVYNALGGEGNLWDKMFDKLDVWRFRIKVFFEDIANYGGKAFKLFEALLERDPKKIKAAYDAIKGFAFRNADALYQNTKQAATAGGALGSNPTTGDPAADAGNNSSLAANTSQQRNVTVNIQNLNEGGINLTTQNIRESANDVEGAFMEMLIRAIRNVEQTI